MNYIEVNSLTRSFGERVLFEGISFSIDQGDKVGLIARNGAGKSTLLDTIVSGEKAEGGRVLVNKDIRVGYLSQNPSFAPGLTVIEACCDSGGEAARACARYEKALAGGEEREIQEAMAEMDRLGAWDYETRAQQILSRLRLLDHNQRVETLSGGQLKRLALAAVLIEEPEMLILDEPTNHLDIEMTRWLEEYLARSGMTLLMVTHDRYFLDKVCNLIIEIDDRTVYTYRGNYSYYLTKRQERLDTAEAERAKDLNLYRRELEWMRRQPQARATKAQARIDSFGRLEDKLRTSRREGNVRLEVKSSYIGTKIFEAKGVSKRFGDKVILDNFDYTFSRGEKLGIIGDNGTGKSTFIKMLLGVVPPDRGSFDVGETVKFGYYSQDGLDFPPEKKVLEIITDIAEVIDMGGGRKLSASQFLQHFLFSPETQHNLVAKLSGGERRRLYLCSVLIGNPNFLILDEPTNDLDIITLNILEDYLRSFDGCLIVVSHDRFFMDKVADHLLVFRGGGVVKDFPGSYTDYLESGEMEQAGGATVASGGTSAAKPPVPKAERSDPSAPARARRMSFKEKEELKALDAEIPALEEEKSVLEQRMSSGSMPPEELMKASERIGELIGLIDSKSMRWLELSEIEG